jgi:hypothetical protein
MEWGDVPGWAGVVLALLSLVYAWRKGRSADRAVAAANDARASAAEALRVAAAAQERSASAQERAAEVAERQAGARLKVRWDGRRFVVTNTGRGHARSLSPALHIGDWWGDTYPDVLSDVPPSDDPSTPPTGWSFDFPLRKLPPDDLLGEPAHLTCMYLEENGGKGRCESVAFRLLKVDGEVRIRAFG